MDILNNKLSWNGSDLGYHSDTVISCEWTINQKKYSTIKVSEGWHSVLPGGNIHCIMSKKGDMFQVIVEDIKELFGLSKIGMHIIKIGFVEYIIYYVPIDMNGTVIWEAPLRSISIKHSLRSDMNFKYKVQEIIAFSEVLALSNTGESQIIIRPSINGTCIPIATNNRSTVINKTKGHNLSILSDTIHKRWFGEQTNLCDVIKTMLYNYGDNLGIVTFKLRQEIEEIIVKHNREYMWYGYYIINRVSRYLLMEI